MKTAVCLGYHQLDVAHAFIRDEGTESELAMGVHPATYGTDYYGRHRAVLPPLNCDIAEDELFGGVEDRLIAVIDGAEGVMEDGDELADATDADLAIETAEERFLEYVDLDQDLSRRDKLVLQQYAFNLQARGDAAAAKKGQTPAQDKSQTFSLPATAVTPKAEKAHRLVVGVRRERDVVAQREASAQPETPRVRNHQAPKVPKMLLRLADARRIR